MFDKPYKKMKKLKSFGFSAMCDCGHKHKFKGNDIVLEKSDSSTAIFKQIYTCPDCKTQYNGIFESISDRNVWYKELSPLGVLVSVILLFGVAFGGYKTIDYITTPTYKDIKDATNKELQDFHKWEQKQKQKEWENSPSSNNGD